MSVIAGSKPTNWAILLGILALVCSRAPATLAVHPWLRLWLILPRDDFYPFLVTRKLQSLRLLLTSDGDGGRKTAGVLVEREEQQMLMSLYCSSCQPAVMSSRGVSFHASSRHAYSC